MCGRYFIDASEDNARLRAIFEEVAKRRLPMFEQVRAGEAFPAQVMPVILVEEGAGYTVRPMKWGFPRAGGGGLVINSRSEKADFTPMFQRAVRERRCLVPMSGFYEWRRQSGKKTKDKFAFRLGDAPKGDIMYLAGLYGQFVGGYENGGYDGFAIMTQAADAQVAPYHDRMPVILTDEALKKAWLNPAVPYAELRAAFETPVLAVAAVAPDAPKD